MYNFKMLICIHKFRQYENILLLNLVPKFNIIDESFIRFYFFY